MNDYEITYRQHFIRRMREREFPGGFGEMLLRDADNYYYDTEENTSIAVKRVRFKDRERDIALVFSLEDSAIALISILPPKAGELSAQDTNGEMGTG